MFLFCSLFPFSGEQVRVLLFRECDWTGRRLLFDSSAVQKINKPLNNQQSTTSKKQSNKEQLPNSCDNDGTDPPRTYIDICNGYGYTYDHASCESNNIGEMVFGSVAMSFRGTSLKVQKNSLLQIYAIRSQFNIHCIYFRFIGCVSQTEFYFLKFSYRQYFPVKASVVGHQQMT